MAPNAACHRWAASFHFHDPVSLTARETESLMSGNIKLISVQEENLLFSYRELYFWKFLTIEATLHCWAEGCNYQQELWVAIEWGDSPKRGGHLDEMLIVICVPGGISPWQYLLPSLDFVLVHMCVFMYSIWGQTYHLPGLPYFKG